MQRGEVGGKESTRKAGESERQLRDVARIVAVSGDSLDLAYLRRWISELELEEVWARIE